MKIGNSGYGNGQFHLGKLKNKSEREIIYYGAFSNWTLLAVRSPGGVVLMTCFPQQWAGHSQRGVPDYRYCNPVALWLS